MLKTKHSAWVNEIQGYSYGAVHLQNKRNLFRFADAFDSVRSLRILFHTQLTNPASGDTFGNLKSGPNFN